MPDKDLSPQARSYALVHDTQTKLNAAQEQFVAIQERFHALHSRIVRYEGLIDEKDARIAELGKQLAAAQAANPNSKRLN